MINIYSDFSQIALNYCKDTEANINNILIITVDFNIRNNIWDLLFPHYSAHSNTLTDIADSLNICLSKSTNQVPTRYVDNLNNSKSTIDLMFLYPNSEEFDNHMIYPEWRILSDHIPLIVKILIFEEHIQTRKQTIVKNSKEERNFIAKIIKSIKRLNMNHI